MDSEIRRIQLKCLDLLKVVDGICRRNNIQYSLCGGSVVGAHLYGGCLLWDDDIDLMMTRQNYDRFINIAKEELPKGISIHNFNLSYDFTTPFTKVMNDNTTIVQQDGVVSGVFLDITVYDRIPQNKLSRIDDFLWKVSQIVMIGKVEVHSMKDKIRNVMLGTVLSNKRCFLLLFQKIAKFLGKSNKYTYSELFGAFANKVRYKPYIFENYIDIDFEGGQFMIVRDYIDYLKTRYNRSDFREPKEKQVAPHYKYVNFDLPYREYHRVHSKNEQQAKK